MADAEAYKFAEQIKNKILNTDSEYWILIFGKTGCGKSVRAQQIGYMIDSTINVDHVCFDKDEFIRAVVGASKGQVVIADEGISMFFNRSAMTRESRLIMELIEQIRQKNLCIIICVPNINSIDKLIQEKVNCIVHVWESRRDKDVLKGCCGFYPNLSEKEERKRFGTRLVSYFNLKRRNPYVKIRLPRPLFRWNGSLIGGNHKKPWYPVDEKLYREKKESILKKYLAPQEKPQTLAGIQREARWKEQRDKLAEKLEEIGYTQEQIGELAGVSHDTIHVATKNLKNIKKNNENLSERGRNRLVSTAGG